MSNPSCRIPSTFASFASSRPSMADTKAAAALPKIRDTFMDPSQHISSKRAIGLFTSGILLAISGRWVWKGLFSKKRIVVPKETPAFEANDLMREAPGTETKREQNIFLTFSEALSSMYRMAMVDPNQRSALLAYAGSSVIGYLSAGLAQGIQETWVRRQETQIRAALIAKLPKTFKQSIQLKQNSDNKLKEMAQKRIYQFLIRYQVPNAHDLIVDRPITEPSRMNQLYFYEPTHRTINFKGASDGVIQSETTLKRPPILRFMDALLLGLGVATGITLQGFIKFFTTSGQGVISRGNKLVSENLQLRDKEAWLVSGIKNPRNMRMLAGFFAMSAAAKLGNLFIDGLREIEVTRVNAQTELMYQGHNWLTLDPSFHQIAEEEALENSLRLLEKDLPHLKIAPATLQQRIQAILTNVGRNSAPKYFPMTPPVGLVVARS